MHVQKGCNLYTIQGQHVMHKIVIREISLAGIVCIKNGEQNTH